MISFVKVVLPVQNMCRHKAKPAIDGIAALYYVKCARKMIIE